MENNKKLKSYQDIIQFLLHTTNYSLKDIADLSDSSMKHIRSIYYDNQIPQNFSSEQQLLRLCHFILEINNNPQDLTKYFSQGPADENF